MTGPVGAYGGLTSIGYRVQSAFGTPNAPAATAGQWAYLLANTLKYDRANTEQEVGAGAMDPTQFIEPGQAKSMGGFEVALSGRTAANLLAFYLGVGSDTPNTTGVFAGLHNHVLTPKPFLRFLTLEDQWVAAPSVPDGQAYELDDIALDQCDLKYAAGKGWSLAFTALGGLGSTSISPPTIPTYPSPPDAQILQWGHVKAASLPQSIPIKHLTNFGLTMKRNVIQTFGAGNFHATDADAGKFQTSGTFSAVFKTAAAASAYQDYCSDLEETLGISIGYGDVSAATTARLLVVALTRARMTSMDKTWAMGSLTGVTVPFRVLDSSNNVILTATNNDASAY